MNYEQARPNIEDGDLIAVKRKTGIFAVLERFFQHSPYTHDGIALWIDGGLWMAELNGGGNHLIPLSQIVDVDFDVYECPVNRADVRAAVASKLRVHVPYGYLSLPIVGILDWLRIKVFLHARRILECAGYCVDIYEAAGWSEHSHLISPAELATLLKLKCSVQASA